MSQFFLDITHHYLHRFDREGNDPNPFLQALSMWRSPQRVHAAFAAARNEHWIRSSHAAGIIRTMTPGPGIR
jgi:hypothetical protein